MKTCTMLICVAAASASAGESQKLHELFAERYAWEMRTFPETAMARGDYAGADRITDDSLAAITLRNETTAAHLGRLLAIDRAELSNDDKLNHDLFRRQLSNELDAHRFRMYLTPIGPRSGPVQTIPQMGERVRFDTFDDYTNYLRRLEQVPGRIDNVIATLRIGAQTGYTPPRVTLLGVPDQLDTLLGGGIDALTQPLDRMPQSLSAEQIETLRGRFAENSLPAVRTSIARLREFLVSDYTPKCRTTIAAHDLPNGIEYYAFRLRVHTTTQHTAQQIHEKGLREVARIKSEMMRVIRKTDFVELQPEAARLGDKELFAAFIHYLRTDARFYHTSSESLLDGYRAVCKRIDGCLPAFFATLPRLPYGVKQIPEFMAPTQTTAYYQQGDIRNGQPGWFYANTYRLEQRPKYEMIALAMHEAVPGHHLQVAIAQELTDVPEFRKNIWVTAFGEGWALYSEHLGVEMGLYGDPYDDFGRLLYEMWRACRLVVDTGIHAFDWPRDRAVQFMLDNTALSELNINNEVDRYIAWPGQATAYKIGELKIRALRGLAEQRMGKHFDIRGFHDTVLGAGSVPLDIMEARVRTWMATTPPKDR